MPFKADVLNDLADDDLRAVIARCNELLQQRDRERKNKALEDARAILASVGLNLKDVASGRSMKNGGKAPVYQGGRTYRHPVNHALTWNAKGQKPTWLRELEAEGRKAVEVTPEPLNDNIGASTKAANDNTPPALKRAG